MPVRQEILFQVPFRTYLMWLAWTAAKEIHNAHWEKVLETRAKQWKCFCRKTAEIFWLKLCGENRLGRYLARCHGQDQAISAEPFCFLSLSVSLWSQTIGVASPIPRNDQCTEIFLILCFHSCSSVSWKTRQCTVRGRFWRRNEFQRACKRKCVKVGESKGKG